MNLKVLTYILLLPMMIWSQRKDDLSKPDETLQLIARAQQGKVLLRWAPESASVWKRGNAYGYTLERFTVYRNGKRLEEPEPMVLSQQIIRPAPLEQWKELALTDNNAAIMAQALYGDDFEIGTEEGELMRIVNQAEMLQQRFSFALFAADMNFEAAKLAGLGFEDTNVKSNEGYLYRIRSGIPKELMEVRVGSVFIEASETEPLPPPIDLVGVFQDKSVVLTWEYEMFKAIYTTYHVERSEDGNTFKRLSKLPFLNLNNKPDNPAKRMYYIDTLPQNGKRYHYRVLGISPFGEQGQPSESISGMGKRALSNTPFISRHDLVGATGAKISWEFPKTAENEVKEFQVRGAPKEDGPYESIKEKIPAKDRTVEVDGLSGTNYLKVVAVGKDSTETSSFAALVQLIDSIPPNAPKGLVGVIDSTGVARISWDANVEKDLLGYRVFRGNLEKEEYVQLTVSPITSTSFQDSVQLKSLNDKVFYSIVAVDQRFNNSAYSEPISLKKPDVVPPSAPVFKSFKVADDGVQLSWIMSSSPDVAKHQIYRKKVGDKAMTKNTTGENVPQRTFDGWELVWETHDTISRFLDTKVASGTKYSYGVRAMDDGGLLSSPSPTLTIETAADYDQESVSGLNAAVDRVKNSIKLYWKKPSGNVREWVIYKSKSAGRPVLWRQLPGNLDQVTDKNISPSNSYHYQIRPVLADGGFGKLERLEVNY